MTDFLTNRHIGISESDEEKMLQTIGVKSLDELVEQTIPSNIRLTEKIELPESLTERQYSEHIAELGAKNKIFTSYIGRGWYVSCTPAVFLCFVFLNPGWCGAETP